MQTKILLIDDDPQFGQLTKLNLSIRGYEVEHVSDSSKAVPTAKTFEPDLILLDMVMPGDDGGDVKAKLQRDPHLNQIPIIFVTALVSVSDVSEDAAVITGDGIMLPKTVQPDLLVQFIEEKLSERLPVS